MVNFDNYKELPKNKTISMTILLIVMQFFSSKQGCHCFINPRGTKLKFD